MKVKLAAYFGFVLLLFAGWIEFADWNEAQQNDAYYRDFAAHYDHSFDTYTSLGVEGFEAKWLTEEEEQKLDCQEFDYCAFMRIATITRCAHALRIDFSLFDEADVKVQSEFIVIDPIEVGQEEIVEIGSNTNKEFATFLPEDATCVDEGFEI